MRSIRNSMKWYRRQSNNEGRRSVIYCTICVLVVGALLITGAILLFVHFRHHFDTKESCQRKRGNPFKCDGNGNDDGLEASAPQTLTYDIDYPRLKAKYPDLKAWAYNQIDSLIAGENGSNDDINILINDVKKGSAIIEYVLEAKTTNILKNAIKKIDKNARLERFAVTVDGKSYTTETKTQKGADPGQKDPDNEVKIDGPNLDKKASPDPKPVKPEEIASKLPKPDEKKVRINPDPKFIASEKTGTGDPNSDKKGTDTEPPDPDEIPPKLPKVEEPDLEKKDPDRVASDPETKTEVEVPDGKPKTPEKVDPGKPDTKSKIPEIPKFGSLKEGRLTTELKLEDTKSWNRHNHEAQNILNARDDPKKFYGDSSFKQADNSDSWPDNMHFDWWMFPWNAGSSGFGDTYRISDGDVVDLIMTDHFIDRYVKSAEYLMESAKMTEQCTDIRYTKIICSFVYFWSVSDYIGDTESSEKLRQTLEELKPKFVKHHPEFEAKRVCYDDSICLFKENEDHYCKYVDCGAKRKDGNAKKRIYPLCNKRDSNDSIKP